MIKEILKDEQVILETKVLGKIKVSCVISKGEPNNLYADRTIVDCKWSIGNKSFEIKNIPWYIKEKNNTLKDARKFSRLLLKYYEKHFATVLKNVMVDVYSEAMLVAHSYLDNKPVNEELFEMLKVSTNEEAKKRQMQPIERGRPFNSTRYKTGNKLVADLNNAVDKLKSNGKKVSITAVCHNFSPSIDVDVYRSNCKKFKLNPNELIDLAKIEPLPTYAQLLKTGQCITEQQ